MINYDRDFFNTIDTEEKAYFLGLFMADGYVQKSSRGYYVSLELQKKDVELLTALHTAIQLKRNPRERRNSVRTVLSSKKMFFDLVDKGCTQAKSFTLKFPTSMKDNNHFIRGYFDGDGWIHRNSLGICGTQEFLSEIQSTKPFANTKLIRTKTDKILSLVTYRNTEIQIIGDFLYKDANIYLSRKQEVFAR